MRPDADLTADPEPILYDERNPRSAVVLGHISAHIEVDDDGRLTEGRQTEGFFKPYNDLWIPLLCAGAWRLFHDGRDGDIVVPGAFLNRAEKHLRKN